MDQASLRAQLEQLHRESYTWALHCCTRSSDAADVLQTVYLKILEGTAQYNAKATFKTWLFAVIRNTAADAYRRARRKQMRLVQTEAFFDTTAPPNRLDDQMDQRRLQTLFRKALADLSERQREVMLLVMYHDLTLDEAARVMGVSLGSARTHYDRGKKRLRQWMETTGVFDATR